MDRLHKVFQHLMIRYQHESISNNFDILKNVIEGHIITEDKYNPKTKEHTEKHAVILRKIDDLEIELKEHLIL